MKLPPPPGAEDVTLGEIARRLDRHEREIGQALRDIRGDIASLSYVPVGTYEAHRAAMAQQVAQVVADVAEQAAARDADRRLIWTSLVAPVLMLVIGVVLYAAVGGGP